MSVSQDWESFKVGTGTITPADNLFSPGTMDGMTKIAIVKAVSKQLNITQPLASKLRATTSAVSSPGIDGVSHRTSATRTNHVIVILVVLASTGIKVSEFPVIVSHELVL